MKRGNRRALNKKYYISILMTPLNETEDGRIERACGLQGTELCLHSVFSELCSKHHQTVFLQGFKVLWSGRRKRCFTEQPKIGK